MTLFLGLNDAIQSWNALGLHAAMAFLILMQIVAWILAMRLFGDKVLPLAKNHLEHIQGSFDRLATNQEHSTEAYYALKDVQEAQSDLLRAHNELTRELIDRLPKNSRVKRLVDDEDANV